MTQNGFTPEPEEYLLTDEIDHEILMHRDAHYGGSFEVMLDYYQSHDIESFDHDRMAYLAKVEEELGKNLASMILSGAEIEEIAQARRAYSQLQQIYQQEEGVSPYARLIADLILADEEEVDDAIEALIAKGPAIIPTLIQLLASDEAYDPLFPGYGYAPAYAIECLAKFKDPSAIAALFETLNVEMVFEEEVILHALKEIGTPARDFLMKVVASKPLSRENIHAAYALTAFGDELEVAKFCLAQLTDPEAQQGTLFSSYLISNCMGLHKTPHEQAFIDLAHSDKIPESLALEMQALLKSWK